MQNWHFSTISSVHRATGIPAKNILSSD